MVLIEELGVSFLFLVIGFIIAGRLKLPSVVGVLLAGALIGPHALGLIKESETLNSFADLGATLLLFIIGLEFSINKILKFGVRALLIEAVKISLVFILIYETSLIMGLSLLESLLLGMLFTFSSTTLFIKLTDNSIFSKNEDINLLVAILIIEDIIAVFMLTFVSGLASSQTIGMNELVFYFAQSIAILAVAYLFLQKIISRLFNYLSTFKNDETIIFATFSIAALFAVLATLIGLQPSIGAFLAGSILSTLKDSKKIQAMISPLGLFFSSFFFLYIGMMVSLQSLASNLLLLALLVIISAAAKFGITFLSFYFMGRRENPSILSGILMLTASEFALIIAKDASKYTSLDIVGITAAAVFITALMASFSIRQSSEIFSFAKTKIPLSLKNDSKKISGYTTRVFREIEPGGGLFRTYTCELSSVAYNLVLLVLVNGVLFLLGSVLEAANIVSFYEFIPNIVRILAHLIVSLFFIVSILRSVDYILSGTVGVFKRNTKRADYNKRIMKNLKIMGLMAVLFILLPIIVSILLLPDIFSHLALIPLLISILLVFDTFKTVYLIVRGEKKYSYSKNLKPKRFHIF